MESMVDKPSSNAIVKQDVESIVRTISDMSRLCGKRLLITGGTGFIGTWLLETISWLNDCRSFNCTVYVPTRNPDLFAHKAPHLARRPDIVLLPGQLGNLETRISQCDVIIHAAAPADPRTLKIDPLSVAEAIVAGTKQALEFAVRRNVASFLFISSGAVYGTQPSSLSHISEDYIGGLNTSQPQSAYGEAKRYAEVLCTLYHDKFGVPIHIARPFTFVGPYQSLNAGFAVTDFIRNGLKGLPIYIEGDGTTVRSYSYAADLTAALWKVLLDGPVGRAYNVGSDEPISILELAHQVVATLNSPVDIIVSSQPVPGQLPSRYVPDTRRGMTELGLTMWTNLKEALRRTTQWMQETQP